MKLGEDGMQSHRAGATLQSWRKGPMVEEFQTLNGVQAKK